MLLLAALLFGAVSLLADTPSVLLKDDFSQPDLKLRRAARGPWLFENQTATCTQDDELYKKFKDHGPIIFYDLGYEDATVSFRYRADSAVKSVVFTANGADGHVFRFVTSARGTGVRAFPVESKDHKAVSLGNETPKLKPGEWVPVKVTLNGPQAIVKIGDFEKTYEHPSLAREKTNLSIGFSFGSLAVQEFVVSQ